MTSAELFVRCATTRGSEMKSVTDRDAVDRRPGVSLAAFRQMVDSPGDRSERLRVDQSMIDGFAALTGDDAFIHVNPEHAAGTRFGGTVAHWLLTLSLLPRLLRSATPEIDGTRMGVNYGFDRVRFVRAVPAGSVLCARFELSAMDEVEPYFFRIAYDVTVEIEGQSKPALYARWLLGRWIDRAMNQDIKAPPAADDSSQKGRWNESGG